MPRLTSLPLAAAQDIGKKFGLDLVRVDAVDLGALNSEFMLRTRDQDAFIASVHETRSLDEAREALELVEWLVDQGVPTVRTERLVSGALVASFEGKPVSLYQYPSGQMSCQMSVTQERCHEVGAALAGLHCVPTVGRKLAPSKFDIPYLQARLTDVDSLNRFELNSAVARLRTGLGRLELLRAAQLPEGIIHGELTRSSVIWQGDRISALICFEAAGRGRFAYDLMGTMLNWCYQDRFDQGLIDALFAGYQSVRRLTPEEVAALPEEAAIAALRFACTRLGDFSVRVPLGVQPARDYRRFLERLTALQSGVVELLDQS